MLDVVKLLGPGWKVDDSAVVTASNQMEHSNDLPDVCELKEKAAKVASAWGGYPSYAPPIGWTVYWVSKPSGSAGETLSVEDTLWVDPAGMAYSITSCAKGVTSGEEAQFVVEKKKDHTWLLLGGLALLAWFTFSK